MDLLPAYVALLPWARGQRVLVLGPRDLQGARRLRDAGASHVRVVDAPLLREAGLDADPSWPAEHQRFDLVVAVETYAEQPRHVRREWLKRAAVSLSPRGWLAARAPHGDGHEVDFWTLEEELAERFPHVFMLAQLPWHGVSLAPVLEEDASTPPQLELDESLVGTEPDASEYLALASLSAPSQVERSRVTDRCLLIPFVGTEPSPSISTPELQSLKDALSQTQRAAATDAERIAELERELERRSESIFALERQVLEERGRAAELSSQREKAAALETELSEAREYSRKAKTDLQILGRQAQDLEAAVSRANESSAARQRELDARHEELRGLGERARSLEAERASLARQMDVAIAEREGTRTLSQRVEAELELSRRRLAENEAALSQRVEEVSKLTTELEVTRAELQHHRTLLEQAHDREEALSAEAAQTVEKSRTLAEVAADRDRLREELGRRGQQIQALEERLWSSREELERARLENVRTAGDAERLKDRAERAHQSEVAKAKELERLGAELHRLELERAELRATVRAHEDEIGRLRSEAETHTSEDEEAEALRAELAERTRATAALRAELEKLGARESEAAAAAARREEQLAEAEAELAQLREASEEHANGAAALQGELDVKTLEAEQLAASVTELQGQLETRRQTIADSRAREEILQRDLEHAKAEEDSLRRRLREREQELEDIVGGGPSSGMELFKLRRELQTAAEANDRLEDALDSSAPVRDAQDAGYDTEDWPPEAVEALHELREQLATQARQHAERLAGPSSGPSSQQRYRLEVDIRAEEQEMMLRELDAAEQKIWEMTDASDRNAARLAASLAQLEKVKEELDETRDELEVARRLLQAAEARALEQERLLASERARLARIGGGAEPEPLVEDVDDLFADLADDGDSMVELGAADAGAPVRRLRPDADDSAGVPEEVAEDVTSARLAEEGPRSPRMTVETLDDEGDEDPWETGVGSAPSKKA